VRASDRAYYGVTTMNIGLNVDIMPSSSVSLPALPSSRMSPCLIAAGKSSSRRLMRSSVALLIDTATSGFGCREASRQVKNDGKTIYKLHVPKSVPVDGFWSVTAYNAKGFITPNKDNADVLNNLTAKKNADGSTDIQFGGCDAQILNCLPIEEGWNYTTRLYHPRSQAVSGTWTFPQAQPAS
jgi:hypothetical protein